MQKRLYHHIRNLLLPCLGFSMATGFFSALLVTAFKLLAEGAVHLSAAAYAAVRERPVWLPLLILSAALIGLLASRVLSLSHSCKGGGIPTSVAAIRGIVSFRWIAGVCLLPFSALLTFLAGLPLGTEGPCVQMGTAVGDGVIKCIGKERHRGWRRYVMTGGASAGFSIATASPISAIVFSMEELHKHFSPLLLSVATLSIMTAQVTARVLASFGIGTVGFLHVPTMATLTPRQLFAPLLIGLAAGVGAILFTRLYHLIDRLMRAALKKLHKKLLFPLLFALIALVGFFFADALGTGHSLVEALLTAKAAWYLLILLFLTRAVLMMLSNTAGATGGVFLPTLAFGAILGAVCADCLIGAGLIGKEHYTLMIVLGVAAFLGATSRIPLTACVFAVEALGTFNNTPAVVIATIVALLVVEASGLEDFTDTMIDAKLRKITNGKQPLSIEAPLTVAPGSFVVGKEMRDVLWPNSCMVVAFSRDRGTEVNLRIAVGDVITVRYITYHPAHTAKELDALVGRQSEEVMQLMTPKDPLDIPAAV